MPRKFFVENIEAVNHLSSFIKEEDKSDLYFILLFLSISPEFSNNVDHISKSSRTKKILKKFLAACSKVDALTLEKKVAQKTAALDSFTTLKLASIYLAEYLTLAGRHYFSNDTFIFLEEHITDKYGFFNTIPRVSRLKAFNSDIRRHIEMCKITDIKEDDVFLILMLRIMGSSPLSSAITAHFNDLVESMSFEKTRNYASQKQTVKDGYFNSFLPTRFVLRKVKNNLRVGSFSFKKNDILFVYLATAAGCPLRKIVNLPFGIGYHTCPGRKVSELILKTVFDALDINLIKKSTLSNHKVDNAGAFLLFD